MRKLFWAAVVAFAACGVEQDAANDDDSSASTASALTAPYPASTVITSFTWDWTTLKRFGGGSDIWPVTWGPDGNVYTAWGDGGGFHGSDSDHRASVGFGYLTGTPPNIDGVSVWGNAAAPVDAAQAKHQATFCGKSASLVSVAGTLYTWIGSSFNANANDNVACPANPAQGFTQLAYSTNLGATWTQTGPHFTGTTGTFALAGFINFGKDYSGVPASLAGYVYMYVGIGGKPDPYLARVPIASLKDTTQYRLFTGVVNGQPTWSSSFTTTGAVAIFHDANNSSGLTATYQPKLGVYLATTNHGVDIHGDPGATQKLGIFESANPWGPWHTVYYSDAWGPPGLPFGSTEFEGLDFPAAWNSADGKTLWGVYSSEKGTNAPGDALVLTKAVLTTAGTPPPPPPSGPLAYWKLDETSGSVASDSSGNGLTGTLMNGPLWTPGKIGGAIHLDGVDDYITFGDPPALQLTGSMTASAWVKASVLATTHDMAIVSKRSVGTERGWQLYIEPDPDFVFCVASNDTTLVCASSNTVPVANTWYHVAGVFDAAAQTIKIYVNGALEETDAAPSSQFNSTNPVLIGNSTLSGGGRPFAGAIDDVHLYARALSAAEVATLAGK